MLIAAQPTRGLDVGAIEYLHRRLVEERDEGRAILLVSLELDEILSLSDRILVIYEGEIVGEHSADVSEEEIGLEMLGGRQERSRERACRRSRTPADARAGRGDRHAGGADRAPATGRRHRRAACSPVVLAFLIGGLVVLATGHNPLLAYRDIFNGAGLNWIFHPTTDTASTLAPTTCRRRCCRRRR